MDSNNEANSNLISLIKELSSANNKLKSEVNEYREILTESRNEVTSLQNRIEDMETASVAGFLYPGSYATTASIASPLNKNFPQNMDGDLYSEDIPSPIHSSIPQNIITSFGGSSSYNASNNINATTDPPIHSPADSLLSAPMLSSSNPLHYHHHYHHYHHCGNENPEIVKGGSVFGELEKYLMKKKTTSKSGGSASGGSVSGSVGGGYSSRRVSHSSLRKGKNVVLEIEEEDNECLTDSRSDISESKRKRFEDYNSDSLLTYTDNESDQDTFEVSTELKILLYFLL